MERLNSKAKVDICRHGDILKKRTMTKFKVREPAEGLRRRKVSDGNNFLENRVESILTENNYRTIQFIDVHKLIPFKNQKRSYFDTGRLKTLSDTIKEHGVRQPLTVIQSETSNVFEIISGERRFLAAQMAGLDKVPCILIHNRGAAEEIALIENVQRVDLHPIELGRAYFGLINSGIVSSNSELSAKVGVPRTQVSEYISFSKLPDFISEQLISNAISSRRILRKFSRCSDVAEMEKMLQQVIGAVERDKKKIILTFSLIGTNVEAKLYDNIKLSEKELVELCAKFESAIEFIKKDKYIKG